MEQTPLLIKLSNLHNIMGMLAHSLHTGIKHSVDHQTNRVMAEIDGMVGDCAVQKSWASYIDEQEVFKEPEFVHAFVKLQSTVPTFITAFYLGNVALTQAAYMTIKGYLNKIRAYHGLDNL